MSTNSTKQKLLTLVDEFDIITRFSNRPHITTVYITFFLEDYSTRSCFSWCIYSASVFTTIYQQLK